MKFETRMDEDGKIVLRLGMTHEAGFPVEPDIDTIVNGVQLLVEAVCGISVFELTRAVIKEYAKNGKPPEGWTNESIGDGEPGTDEQGSSVVSAERPEGDDDSAREEPEGSG